MNPEQISSTHRARVAYVYIRQSSVQQVLHHQESQRRQRALVERAVQLGWARERVQLLDEDLGRSGARTQRRSGFERLLAAVALGLPRTCRACGMPPARLGKTKSASCVV
jgi:DNA invertase Pin-like site-specific DNA recombinase